MKSICRLNFDFLCGSRPPCLDYVGSGLTAAEPGAERTPSTSKCWELGSPELQDLLEGRDTGFPRPIPGPASCPARPPGLKLVALRDEGF